MEQKAVSRVYCEPLDKFVGIKTCSDEEAAYLVRDIPNISGKKAYYELIISYCVVNYFTDISPFIEADELLISIEDVIKEDLYRLCIKVNSGLDIREVRITSLETPNIPLLGFNLEQLGLSDNLGDLEQRLSQDVIGQDPAIESISNLIKRSAIGLKEDRRPLASFSFVGKTGVGKTEMAKALSRCLYGGEDESLVRIDCSEYSQPHEYAKLIGSPPGYIGHNDGGALTEALKKKPNVVVLFDEIEKAHKKVHNLLLQIMDDGRLTDSKGHTISFGKALIIMTSNVGVEPLKEYEKSIGFTRTKIDYDIRKRETVKDFERKFSPEFINRIDEIIVFRDLDDTDKKSITKKMLNGVKDRAMRIGVELDFAESVADFIIQSEPDSKYGARPLKRAIARLIEFPLADLVLKDRLPEDRKVRVSVTRSKIRIGQ